MATGARTTPLIARDQILRELWLEVAASADQGMRAAAVRGPAGSGKTRVLGAFAERARSTGATVVAGRAPALGGHPYGALADALAGYVRSSPPAGAQVRRAGTALARLVPALVALDGAEPASLPNPLAVVQGIYRLVHQVTQRRPLVLIVDDAHLADADSCEALGALQRHAADLPWTLLLGWRDPADEVHTAPRRLLELLRRDRACRELILEPFGPAAAGEFVAALLGDGLPAPSLVEMLNRRSAGNPYYLEELVRWLRDSGRLHRAGLQWVAAPGSEGELPPSLEEALRERARALPDAARTALGWLSVAGGGADLGLLEAVSGLSPSTLAEGLDVLIRSGLVADGAGRRAEYRVHHPLVAESVYRGLSVAHRRLHHQALARALASRGEPPGAIATHHVRAADPGDAEALGATLAAAADAEARTSFLEAVNWYEAVLALAAGADDPARLLALDRLSELAGHAGRLDLGLRAIEELTARAVEGDQLRRATLLRRLATLRIIAGDTAAARAAIEEGLALGAAAGAEAALLLAELAMVAELTMSVGEVLDVVARGRAAALASGAVAAEVVLSAFEAVALADSGHPRTAARLAAAAAERAAEAEEFLAFGYAAFALGVTNLVLGRFHEAREAMTAIAQVSEDAGLVWGAAWMWEIVGQAELFLGDLDAAVRSDLRAEELAQRQGGASVMPMPTVQMALALALQGKLAAAEERLADARRWLDERPSDFVEGWYWQAMGALQRARGRPGEAVECFQRMVEHLKARGRYAQFSLYPELVHALVAAGDAGEGLRVAREIVEILGDRDLPLAAPLAQAALAAALSASGEHPAAIAAARRAAQLAGELDGALIPARVGAVLGRVLAAAGQDAEAVSVLGEAHGRLAALPWASERDDVAGHLARLGAAPEPVAAEPIAEAAVSPATIGPLDGLSRREAEVAEIAATGLSSRGIAMRLGLSERTVENHLQRVYTKLGLHSRAELIAVVAGTRP
jgi:DNA-binding CsgD family transcriptional regulator/tetratricopeptide (TPR) repeat protein